MTGMTKYERICQPLVAVVACGLNLPPLILGLLASADWCPYYGHFLAPNTVFCFVNICAAFFSIYKLRQKIQFDVRYNAQDDDDTVLFGTSTTTANNVTVLPATSNIDPESNSTTNAQDTGVSVQVSSNENENTSKGVEVQVETGNPVSTPSEPSPETPQDETLPSQTQNPSNGTKDAETDNETTPQQTKPPHSCFRRCLKLRTTSSNRIRHLVCYNGLITTYGILFLFWAFWLGSGEQLALTSGGASESRLEGCSDSALESQYNYVTISVVVGYAYFGFIMICLVASYCDPE